VSNTGPEGIVPPAAGGVGGAGFRPAGADAGQGRERPAFYALAPGGWRDYVTLLHPPYTLWHLSYVAVGAGLASRFSWTRLVLALAAFALAMGVGAHALDELRGRPLQTHIPDDVLWTLAAVGVGAGTALGVYACIAYTWLLAPFVAFGTFIVVAYNLESFGGRLHSTFWFALAWGGLPALSAYVVEAETIRADAIAIVAYATLLSYAQRVLSTPVRDTRRRVVEVTGTIARSDGGSSTVTRETLMGSQETALRLLAAGAVALGAALLLVHV
jgi:hypothetical protein